MLIDFRKQGERRDLRDRLERRLGTIDLEGKTYEPIATSSVVLTVVWADFPIVTFVYRELERTLRGYFKDKSENAQTIL
jgi:hypothetical protein